MLKSTEESTSPSTAPLVRGAKTASPRTYMPMLICVEGIQSGVRFALQPGANIVGRSSAANIVLQDDMASRRHACIMYRNSDHHDEPPECVIDDLDSRNGTELNGALISQAHKLAERDRLLIGTTLLGFFLRDEKELENEQLLYEMATRDSLTGLDNRHQFRTHLKHHVERGKRYGFPVSMIVVDADHFKAVNDHHGHDIGDKVLIHLARLIQSCCRSSELCARWGGEEFVILLPDGDLHSAYSLAERVRVTVESNPLRQPVTPIYLSISAGCAELGLTEDAETLFRRADQNLLAAKRMGRNKVCCE